MSFTSWYRSTLDRNGRVVWWEHLYAIMPIPMVVGMMITRYYQTIWPFAIATILSFFAGLWSYKQDLIVHNTDDERNNTVRDVGARVPRIHTFYATVMLVLLGVIFFQWWLYGRF